MRHAWNARAFCLSVRGFISPPIREALALNAGQGDLCTLCILNAQGRTVRIAEIELREIAVQMSGAAMLVGALRA